MADSWYYWDGADQRGPVSLDELTALVRSGAVTAATDIRKEKDAGWSPAARALPDLFAAPPVPGSATSDAARPAKVAKGGWTDTAPHPWRRYAARLVDNTVVGAITWMLIGIVFFSMAPEAARSFFNLFKQPYGPILDGLLTLACAMPGNAIMIGLTGLSLGKWLFGIRVLKNGAPIGLLTAFRREISVWIFGLAAGLPFISLFTLIGAFQKLEGDRITRWDRAQKLTVVHRPEGAIATILMWIVAVAFIGLQVALRVYNSTQGRL